MKYKVDGWNNFCRVFEIPEEFPNEYCFGGGIHCDFVMKDWFSPVFDLLLINVPKEEYQKHVDEYLYKEVDFEELEKTIVDFVKVKKYITKGRKYLILYSFGAATIFEGE